MLPIYCFFFLSVHLYLSIKTTKDNYENIILFRCGQLRFEANLGERLEQCSVLILSSNKIAFYDFEGARIFDLSRRNLGEKNL